MQILNVIYESFTLCITLKLVVAFFFLQIKLNYVYNTICEILQKSIYICMIVSTDNIVYMGHLEVLCHIEKKKTI
jgi:hypothetical protein